MVEDGSNAFPIEMTRWSEGDFLERLMPRLHERRKMKGEPCPDAESLAAFTDHQVRDSVREAIAAHLTGCSECARIHHQLLNFSRTDLPGDEPEWRNTEKRLDNWLDVFLRSHPNRSHTEALPASASEALHRVRARRWWPSWRGQLTVAVAAGIVLVATMTLLLRSNPDANLATRIKSQMFSDLQLKEANLQVTSSKGKVTLRGTVPNDAARSEAYKLASQTPGVAGVDDQMTVQETLSAQLQSEPPSASMPSSRIPPEKRAATPRQATENRPVAQAPLAAAPAPFPEGASQNAVVLTPEIKQAIAEEVKAELAAERDAAVIPEQAVALGEEKLPPALDAYHRTFVVSTTLGEQMVGGEECALRPGDILTRIDDTTDANKNVRVLVRSSQQKDCPAGMQVMASLRDLENMDNDLHTKIDEGLRRLADNQGKDGMPSSPAANSRANPAGQAQPDPTAEADLQQQQQVADKIEAEVQQAKVTSIPGDFHKAGSVERGALSLTAWVQDNEKRTPPTTMKDPTGKQQQTSPPSHQAAPTPKPGAPAQHSGGASTANHTGTTTTRRAGASTTAGKAGAPLSNASKKPGLSYPNGSLTRITPRGTLEYNSNGTLTSLTTSGGTVARFNSRGTISSVHAGTMTITHAPNGGRTIETTRPDGSRVVALGPHRGYVERPFTQNSRFYMSCTYVANGHSSAYVYARYSYHGWFYYNYVPAYYYGAGFYDWAYNPWAAPVAWGWGWRAAPWYGYYGHYLNPYPVYSSAAFWLTDYVLAENLRAAYEAQAEANASLMKRRNDAA